MRIYPLGSQEEAAGQKELFQTFLTMNNSNIKKLTNLASGLSIFFVILMLANSAFGKTVKEIHFPNINKTTKLYPDLNGFEGWMDTKKLIFNGLEASYFHNHFALTITLVNIDSIPFATVILYRPDNQLSRKYKLRTNTNGALQIAKKEVIKIDAYSNTFFISVDAVGHKKEDFTFNLSQNKTHYFRIQDRNNYSGFRAFLEVIEVTEETFKRDKL